MMVQSVVSALAKRTPDAAPKDTLCLVNEVLYDNIRSRLTQDEHVTFSLIRYTTDGRFVFAGAHEEILVVRAKDRDIEIVETPGTWLGARPDIRGVTVESTLQLLPGDVVVLYTDGITEARNASDEVFGEHLYASVKAVADQPVEAIRDHVLAELAKWMVVQDDDCTLVVIRYRGNVLPA
jgi:phosphoserine phosphatase RsbU/P